MNHGVVIVRNFRRDEMPVRRSGNGHAGIDIPEDERARVLVVVVVAGIRVPPTTQHDHAAGKDDTFVSPKRAEIDVTRILVSPVLHHGHALPARNTLLRRQRVEVARSKELLTVILTLTFEAE